MSLGSRLSRVISRMAALTYGASLWLFEAALLKRVIKWRAKRRLPRAPPGGDSRDQIATPAPRRNVHVQGTAGPERGGPGGAIPIVFIHQSNSEHLTYSLAQARKSNPNSTVFLLGDDSNDGYPGVEHHRLSDYSVGAAQFEEVYTHYSTHSVSFELVCFQRWFILRDFLAARQIEQCVYLDSDVLLYADVSEDISKFRRFDFTLCWNTIGCVFFLNRLDGLERLCQFMLDLYTRKDPYLYDRMVAHFASRQKNHLPGGTCDMTALQFYNELNFGRIGEASYIIDGSVYDPNINMPHPGFEMEDGIKKITWHGEHPYGTYLPTGESIRFNSLHFNGQAKALMGRYCTVRREADGDRRHG
ncbi:MAG: hypothetical protein ABI868_06240 [Acidobacteriota bacterium]